MEALRVSITASVIISPSSHTGRMPSSLGQYFSALLNTGWVTVLSTYKVFRMLEKWIYRLLVSYFKQFSSLVLTLRLPLSALNGGPCHSSDSLPFAWWAVAFCPYSIPRPCPTLHNASTTSFTTLLSTWDTQDHRKESRRMIHVLFPPTHTATVGHFNGQLSMEPLSMV